MSKSRGNVIDPVPVLAERGADALRWYMFSSGSPWTPKRVYVEGIDEATRQFLLTLWNTYSFFVDLREHRRLGAAGARRSRRRTSSTAGSPRACTARSAPPPRRSRASTRSRARRRWPSSSTTSRTGTCAAPGRAFGSRPTRPRTRRCTRRCSRSSQLLAPFCPFVADELFRNLAGTDESVHLERLARVRRGRDRRRARSRDGAGAHARVARPRGARRRQARRAPAAPPRDRAAHRGRAAARRRRAARSRTS